jgi:UrcA family protein
MNVSTCKSTHHSRTLALFVVCFLGTTAWAGPPATRSLAVSFRDLDLSTSSGAAKLYRRIQSAARGVCQYEPSSPRGETVWRYCVRPTVDAAVTKVNSPLLTALHSDHSSPVVTALNK